VTRHSLLDTDHESTRTASERDTTETPTTTADDTSTTETPTMTADDTSTTETPTMTADDTSTTEAQTRTRTAGTAATMGEVDQTHPDTNETFGFTVYGRGVATDGGGDTEEESMEDVDHESDTGGSNRTFERGKDGGDE
jgi:hypothetical protein